MRELLIGRTGKSILVCGEMACKMEREKSSSTNYKNKESGKMA